MSGWLVLYWQWRFRRYRVEYLRYLSALLEHLAGQQTIKNIFANEVQRYGRQHVRGQLAQLWLERLAVYGGDLARAWQGCFAPQTLQVISVSQRYGVRSLTAALGFLAMQQERSQTLNRRTLSILWPAIFALLVVGFTLILLPTLTVPELRQVFAVVPQEHYGRYTRLLFDSAAWLERFGWLLFVLLVMALSALAFSLRYLTGPLRSFLDRYEPWKSYRYFGAWQMLQMLHILLALTHLRIPLKQAVVALSDTANPWFRMHIERIHVRILQGEVGPESFATGLLDEEDLWFLVDMAQGRSLAHACALTADRLADRFEQRLLHFSVIIRWGALLMGIGLLALLLYWHYQAFEELRQGLLNVFA